MSLEAISVYVMRLSYGCVATFYGTLSAGGPVLYNIGTYDGMDVVISLFFLSTIVGVLYVWRLLTAFHE